MKGRGPYLTALRRGVALGLAITALWGAALLADGSALTGGLADPALLVELLSHRLADPGREERALEGWGRLLLARSPLLAAGEEAVLRLRRDTPPEEGPEEPSDPLPGDGEDQTQPDLAPPAGDGVVEMTARGKEGSKYLFSDGVWLYNRTDKDLTVDVLSAGRVDCTLGEGPQILILHTHGSEAYTPADGLTYRESDPYRTTDCTRNVVRVGEEMATVFRAHGFQVVHDTTLYDYPAYSGAYDRSGAAVKEWLERYPTIGLILDVHRDALVGSEGEVYKLVSREAGATVAQIMLVVGTDGTGAAHPRWRDNLALAARLQRGAALGYESLARPIVLRNSRYNQHLLPGSLLVEVGGHGNTLTEALAGARLWADNVSRTLKAMEG